MLIYIRGNNNLGLRHYDKIEDGNLSDLLRYASINTENQLMVLSDSRCQECTDTGISTGAYIVFYKGVTIDHCTHVPIPVSQSSAESDYNVACTAVISLARFRMISNDFLNKDPYVVPEQAPLIILDIKSVYG